MNANITLSQIYYNESLLSFFFREQSKKRFESIVSDFCITNKDMIELESKLENSFLDWDDCEEFFYDNDIEEIKDFLEL